LSNSASSRRRSSAHIPVLVLALVIGAVVAVFIGRFSSNPADVVRAVLGRLGLSEGRSAAMETVLFRVRIPRIMAALMIGSMLSLSGAVYQGVFRNVLVSPDILGVSSGAAVGAAGAILLGLGMAERQLLAFAGGLTAVLIATAIPRLFKNTSNLILVLSGIIVGGFLASLLAMMKFVADEQVQLAEIVFWQMGSLASIGYGELAVIAPAFLAGTALLLGLSWRINILSFGEFEARALGTNLPLVRGIVIALSSLLTAAAVSVAGTIGWVGLIVPHLARLWCGSDHVKMLPTTALLGALFMLLIDTVARAAFTMEIPLSILSGLVGAPAYAWLLYRQRAHVS
jgi:iron complex transport system permease protein